MDAGYNYMPLPYAYYPTKTHFRHDVTLARSVHAPAFTTDEAIATGTDALLPLTNSPKMLCKHWVLISDFLKPPTVLRLLVNASQEARLVGQGASWPMLRV